MARPRVLVAAYAINPPGGGNAVGAWTLQALREEVDLTVLTWAPVDVAAVNAAFGTSLRPEDCTWRVISAGLRRLVDSVPLPLTLLKLGLMMRESRALDRRAEFDAIVGTMNELDVGRRAVQYVHYPYMRFPRPDVDYRWYHQRTALRAYRGLCGAIAQASEHRIRENLTLVNSDWTGRVYREFYDSEAETLYPPVPGGFPEVPFELRRDDFVIVGRLSPEKNIVGAMRILAQVRARGFDIGLHIVGPFDHAGYAKTVGREAAALGGWIKMHGHLPRAEMVELIARCRFGIHGMVGEHFGIAPAEMQRGGCIVFVSSEGGPVEIVGADDRVTFDSAPDAVAKITRVLSDPKLRRAVLEAANARSEWFSEQRFMQDMRRVVRRFIGDRRAGLQPRAGDDRRPRVRARSR